MTNKALFYAVYAAVMLLLPAGVCGMPQDAASEPSAAERAPDAETVQQGSYRVLNQETGTVSEISVRDYLIGAVGAEMPASYEPAALTAQAVAAHTYAEYIRRLHEASPEPSLHGADFSDDSREYQAFYTADELRACYGDAFDESYAKLAASVDAAGDLLLCWQGEPIVAAFHAVSSGMTESAEAVWGHALPYLVSVPSESDCNAPLFEEQVFLSPETVRKALLNKQPDTVLPDDPAAWFSGPVCSPAGTVLEIHAGTGVWSGQMLREALALRSACVTVTYDGAQFCFTTKGFGHDVGMSQYGADAMAKQGSGFEEILAHYYPDTVLCHAGASESA